MRIEDYFKHIDSIDINPRSKQFALDNNMIMEHSFSSLNEFLTYINNYKNLEFDELYVFANIDIDGADDEIYIQFHYNQYSKFYQYFINIDYDDGETFRNFRKKLTDNKYCYEVNVYFKNLLKMNKRCNAIDKLLDINMDI